MTRDQLEIVRKGVREHLEHAASLLPHPVRSGADGGTLDGYNDWLEHNELELALDGTEKPK